MITYLLEDDKVMAFKQLEGVKQIDQGIRYGIYKNVQPLAFKLTMIQFKYVDPLLILTEATRKIEISHWGNIGVEEHFEVQNIGATLKGEFNRVDYEKPRYAINCLTEIHGKYPWYIQGMWVNDYIGNISTTNAYRGEETVQLEFRPRFGICGGWKTDWN